MSIQGHTKLKIWLVLLIVFVLGGVTGAALGGLYRSRASSERPEKAMHDRFEKMRRELNLTDEQTKAVSNILDETRNEYRALHTELKPRFDEPRQKARAKIRALLSAEQQGKFDAMVAQRDAHREEEQKSRR